MASLFGDCLVPAPLAALRVGDGFGLLQREAFKGDAIGARLAFWKDEHATEAGGAVGSAILCSSLATHMVTVRFPAYATHGLTAVVPVPQKLLSVKSFAPTPSNGKLPTVKNSGT